MVKRIKDLLEEENILRPFQRDGYKPIDSYSKAEEGDQKTIAQLAKYGADLTKERHSIHYLYFPTKDDAENAKSELEQSGHQVNLGKQIEDVPTENQWPVSVEMTEIVNLEMIIKRRIVFESIAERHCGEYDGWEAALD